MLASDLYAKRSQLSATLSQWHSLYNAMAEDVKALGVEAAVLKHKAELLKATTATHVRDSEGCCRGIRAVPGNPGSAGGGRGEVA